MKALFKARIRQIKNGMARVSLRNFLMFLGLGGLMIGLMAFFFIKVFGFLYYRAEFPIYFKLFVSEKILLMTFLTMFMMLILSSLIATLNIFFLSRDLPLLLASPLRSRTVFIWKALEVTFSSSLLVVLFSMPALFSYCYFFAPNLAGILAIFVAFFAYIITGVLFGILIGLTIPAFISVKRLQPVLSVVSILLVSTIVVFLRILRPERFGNPDAIDNLLNYMGGFKADGMGWFPFAWLARIMHLVAKQDYSGYFLFLLTFIGLILFLGGFALFLQHKYYLKLFDKLNKGSSGAYHSHWKPNLLARLGMLEKYPAQRDYTSLWNKEIKTFLRSPDQWSQLLVIGAIVVVFILNLKGIPTPHPSVKNIIAYLNMSMAAFVVAGLNSRFTFTAIPMETPGIAHLIASPFEKVKLYRFKLFFYAIPQLLIGIMLFVAGDLALGLDSFARLTGYIFLLPLLPVLTLLALYFSLKLDKSVPITPHHVIMSRSGVSYMIWSLVYIVVCMVYFSRPTFLYYFNRFLLLPVPFWGIFAWIAGFVLINVLVATFLYRRSVSIWLKREA